MTASDIPLSSSNRAATEKISEDGVTRHAQRVVLEHLGAVPRPLATLLATDAGAVSGAVNAAAEATTLKLAPATGEIYRVSELVVQVQGGGASEAGKYADLPALDPGVVLRVQRDGSTVAELAPAPIKTTADLELLAGGRALVGAELVTAAIAFAVPIRLHAGDELQAVLNDDFSTLTVHRFAARGVIETDRA